MTHHARAQISFGRMERVIDETSPNVLAQHSPVYLRGDLPTVPVPTKTDADQLHELTVKGLTYRYEGSENGIHEIDLQIPTGSFIVITGRIGSGKSTLLRTLLGVLPKESGSDLLEWRGG